MTKILILLFISTSAIAQTPACGCFNGIGSMETDKPSLTIEFSNGLILTVCGYEQEKLNMNEVLISEFNVFNCATKESIVEYGAIQNCIVKKDKQELHISELKFLPAGENWKWIQVPIGTQRIFIKENELIVLEQVSSFKPIKIDPIETERFLKEVKELKGKGKISNPEELLGRLEILALNDNLEAQNILFDFENYFKYQTDGAIAEQWKDATSTVEWIIK
jgi:hypothetical protein